MNINEPIAQQVSDPSCWPVLIFWGILTICIAFWCYRRFDVGEVEKRSYGGTDNIDLFGGVALCLLAGLSWPVVVPVLFCEWAFRKISIFIEHKKGVSKT